MTRVKWGRIFTALLILLVFIYGGALLLGVARPEELPGVSAPGRFISVTFNARLSE